MVMGGKDAETDMLTGYDQMRISLTVTDLYHFLDRAFALGVRKACGMVTETADAIGMVHRILTGAQQNPISPWNAGPPADPRGYRYDPVVSNWRGEDDDDR